MRFVSLILVAVTATFAGIYYAKGKSTALENPDEMKDRMKNDSRSMEALTEAHDDMDDRLDDSFPASDPPSWGPRDLLH